MTSSISNSDPAEPRWVRIWVVTIILVAVCVGAWELMVRGAGLGPAHVDNKTLWADTRHQLNRQGGNSIVLLGGSRMQRAIDVQTLSSRFERPVFQLAIEGSSYLPVLEDLAVDPRVSGTIIVSVAPILTFNRELTQLDNGRQARYVENYRTQSLARRLEQKITLFLQEHLALRTPRAHPPSVISEILGTGKMPEPDYKTVYRDRVVHMDLDRMPASQDDDVIAAMYDDHAAPYSEAEFNPVVNYIRTLVDMLRTKGASVYFVRLPTDGAVRELEEAMFPRERFWDVLEASVDATFIHYEAYPQLSGFVSHDGSHIDASQIVEFTNQLSDVLAR